MQNYILIVAGPTGSGKGSLPDLVKQTLSLDPSSINILIDDLVEQNPYYTKQIRAFFDNKLKKGESENDILNLFTNPDEDMVQFFNDAYFRARFNTDCTTGEDTEKDSTTNCENQNNDKLKQAFENKQNIVLETTGMNPPDWVFDSYYDKIKNKYRIIMAWILLFESSLHFRSLHLGLCLVLL